LNIDHALRLDSLRRTGLLDSPAEERFDRLTRLAAAGARAPVAVFSLLDGEREWIKSAVGLTEPLASARELPWTHSLARPVVESGTLLRLEDAGAEPAFRDHPGVVDLGVAAYLAVPVLSRDGLPVGAFAVMAFEPRRWAEEDRVLLEELAALAGAEIGRREALPGHLLGAAGDAAAFLEELFVSNPDAVVLLDRDDRVVRVNRRFEQLFGFTRDEARGRPVNDLLAPGELGVVAEELTGRVLAGERLDLELERTRKDGTRVQVALTAAPLPGGQGTCAVYRDITERHRAREALERREERFRSLTESATDVVAILSASGMIEYMAPSADRTFGICPDEVVGTSFFVMLHPLDAPAAIGHFSELTSAGEAGTERMFETRLQHGGGAGWRTVQVRARDMRNVPAVDGVVMSLRDITTESQAVQTHRRLSTFLEATPDFVATFDPHGRALDVNASFRRILGLTEDQTLADLTLPDLFPPTVTERLLNEGIPAATRHGLWRGETSVASQEGVELPISQVVLAHRDGSGAVEFLSTLGRDISDRKRAEAALIQSEQQFRSLIENAHDIITVIAGDGTALYESPAMERVLGYPPESLLGHNVFDLVHPEDVEHTRVAFEWIREGNTAERLVELRFRHHDGSWREFEAVGRQAEFLGEATAVVINARDIAERNAAAAALHQSEQQLLQAQKMEAVGRLAGGVAHDFNNLLTAIKGFTELLHLDLDERDPRRAFVTEIQSAANRAARLTRQLLAFSRKQVLQPRVLDLNGAVIDMEKMLQRLIGEHLVLETHTSAGLWHVKVDPGQVEQVLMNLVVNARDAMESGGRLDVATRNVSFTAQTLPPNAEVEPGEYVALSVSDTGCGIDEVTIGRIFEPFFTTKEQGKGTGLGLSTVYGIVRQSGGFVHVESEPGHGTTFHVFFPRVLAPSETRVEQPEEAPASGTETILLAEDEQAVRTLVRRVLARAGYQILEAESGVDALQLARARDGTIDLLLTDVVMPGMSGRELADTLLRERPDLRVLYMSGYTDDAISHHGVLDEDVALLEKPFAPDTLLRRIRAVLGAPAAAME
jgi:two-component system, cell cycle sensor histidine kinase and response regulator CckA